MFEILLTYNNKLVHSTIGMTPDDARKKKNELDVWTNTFINSKQNRKYPNLEKGDKVKILRKKGITEKERTSVWSDNAYEVEDVFESKGQTFYPARLLAQPRTWSGFGPGLGLERDPGPRLRPGLLSRSWTRSKTRTIYWIS